MTDAPLIIEKSPQGYAVLTLNRPTSMNALSRDLRQALADAIDSLEADPQVRVLILTGAGKAFCAGLDLKELGAKGLPRNLAGGAGDDERGGQGPGVAGGDVMPRDPVRSLARFTGPVIGAINGAAITGGFELALACDVLLASSEARFADTHARVGVMPGWGLSQKLSRLIGISRAKELSLTGNFVSAQQALVWGLVNRVVDSSELLPQARALAGDMLSVLPHMLVAYKKLIDEGYAATFGEGLELEGVRAKENNSSVSPQEIEARREAIRARAHTQGS